MTLSAEQARARFAYNPKTGILSRKVGIPGKSIGSRVGSVRNDGYRSVELDGVSHYEHRLVWLIVNGEWPERHLDHINGNRADNRIANLRLASVSENAQNRKVRSDNKAGIVGVRKQANAWLASIGVRGRKFHLGSFATKEEARAAYLAAKSRLHEFQPSPRG